jgi:DNA modification methylase
MGDLSGNYVPNHEWIMFASSDDPRDMQSGRPKNVIEYNPPPPAEYRHPTEKPIDLIADLIQNSTRPGDTVLDPFMGSGTTAVAAIRNDREYVGFEVDGENYRDVIERRIGETKRQRDASVNGKTE